MNQKLKQNKGITLIALVITIIVLLILAGVTINMVLGDDGIMAQAQNAKEVQEEAEEKEEEAIQLGEGMIDLHTEGTLASVVEVGDYVKYEYTAGKYDLSAERSGYTEEQSFNSEEEDEVVENWIVLSNDSGVIRLVSEKAISTLNLKGVEGYLNGTDILNEMCEDLYSSDIGKGRSINLDDINKVTGYKPENTLYWDSNDEMKEDLTYGITISEAEKTCGTLTYREGPDGKDVGTYQMKYLWYDIISSDDNGLLQTNEERYQKYQKLFIGDGYYDCYFLASECITANFLGGEMSGGLHGVCNYDNLGNDGSCVDYEPLFDTSGYSGVVSYSVRPVVTLKSGLQVVSGDGSSPEKAWTVK